MRVGRIKFKNVDLGGDKTMLRIIETKHKERNDIIELCAHVN